jgi:cell surface protein SprA
MSVLLAGAHPAAGPKASPPASQGDEDCAALTCAPSPRLHVPVLPVAAPDTDSVAVDAVPESLGDTLSPSLDALGRPDSLRRPDSLGVADTGRVPTYLPERRERPIARLFDRPVPFLSARSASDRSVTLDSTDLRYTADPDPSVDGPLGGTVAVDPETYQRERYATNLNDNWRTLVEKRQQQRSQRGGLGVNIVVPGGRESAFSTIFGKPQVDLRVNGQADINAGFNYRKSDRQAALTGGDAAQVDPDFKQDLRLGITGTIGDKLQIDVDWDTQNQFDYQNQVQLKYTGYEDEIIQSVEAGNVFLETPSQLISGGQSLFGIKSRLQLGNLSLTTIASQQEGQSNTLSIEGGSETTEFDLKPTDYDADTHFFLGYYFRNGWNRAHENPTTLRTFEGFGEITEIEVWKLRSSTGSEEPNVRRAVAVVDLGENSQILTQGSNFTDTVLPSTDDDQYDEQDVESLRDGDVSVSDYLRGSVDEPLSSQDFVDGEFKRLERGRDYTLDKELGYVSLKQRLQSNEALAVAFRYRANNTVRQVGDFASENAAGADRGVEAERLLLKLIRPNDPVAPGEGETLPAPWFLEMRNIYSIGGRGFTQDNFSLDILYTPSGQQERSTLPNVGGNAPLLQLLGLDRINQNGAPSPDQQFDFTSLTINREEGIIIFPYLQPFGERILEVGNGSADAADLAFTELYTKKKTNVEDENTGSNIFSIRGQYKGSTKEFYDLKAFAGLVEGSVEVTAGGQTLEEGTDYVVDYQGGTVTITNQSYLSQGREIEISYEQNSFANLQQKTLLGARADWSRQDRYGLGATVMRLSQKSPVDKYRIGEEPIKNTIWGVDGSMNLEPRWLTQAVDALPLVQTKAESSISLTGEFAQLRPGHTETQAFEDARDRVRSSDEDSYDQDELNGISYIDDFEGFENTFSLRQQLDAWQVSAPPASIADRAPLDRDRQGTADDLERSFWRGAFSWYQLNNNLRENLDGIIANRGPEEATEVLQVNQLFPERDVANEADQALRTLDLYFDPHMRGPYNYTPHIDRFLKEPRTVWGGMTQRLPQGYTDFTLQNVEFVEFIVKVYPEEGGIDPDAKLYVDLGSISEDVLPNGVLNSEDGLNPDFEPANLDGDNLSRLASGGSQDNTINIRNGRTEDLGFDGLVSYTGDPYASEIREQTFYRNQAFGNQTPYLAALDSIWTNRQQLGLTDSLARRLEAIRARSLADPSGDDYHYFENNQYFGDGSPNEFFPDGATLQQRFTRYYPGHELNGFQSQNELATNTSTRRGLARTPDTEDLDGTGGNVDQLNDYYQYEISLSDLDRLAEEEGPPSEDYVVSELEQASSPNWYKIRIPVRSPTRTVGNIDNFTRIRAIRMWTQGHSGPVTMRMASLELVGSQWRTSSNVAREPVEDDSMMTVGDGNLRVASINNEEDADYEQPVGAIVSRNRTSRGGTTRSREQSMLLSADKLAAGRQRAVFKSFNQGLDLLKYAKLRMYVHAHAASGENGEGTTTKKDITDNLRLFVRLGANESDDYYEYVQPVTGQEPPSPNGNGVVPYPWLEENEMELRLSALNQLKVARDQSPTPPDEVFPQAGDPNPVEIDFGPDGTTLRMKGTPSLRNVNTVVIGLRHAGETDQDLRNLEVWVNELRVTGYDERTGWAALTNANVKMADFGEISASFQRKTDGFGGLSSTLTERQQADNTSWNVRSEVNLNKLLPERQGWSIPVTGQVQSSTTSPRFDPNRGDVRISEVVQQIQDTPDDSLRSQYDTDEQFGEDVPIGRVRSLLVDSVRSASETTNLRRTMTANVSKANSESWWVRNTVDATSLSFSYFDRRARSPDLRLNDQWNWSSSMQYRLNFGKPRTLAPLWFLDGVPLLGGVSDLQFNYVPQSLTFTGDAERNVQRSRSRSTAFRASQETLPDRVANPLREQQDFTHRRSFSLQYNPFEFLNLSYDSNTQQNLSGASATSETTVFILDPLRTTIEAEISGFGGLDQIEPDDNFESQLEDRINDRIEAGVITIPENEDADPDNDIENPTVADVARDRIFANERLNLKSEDVVFEDLFFGGASPRTNSYRQRFTSTLRPSFTDGEALNWIDLQDVVYRAEFQWTNGAEGSITGAQASNQVSIRSGINLHPNRVWERFGFFQAMKDAQQRAQSDDDARNRRGNQRRGRRDGDERNGDERGEDEQDADGDAPDGEAASDEADEEDEDVVGQFLKDLLPNPLGVLRRFALTFLDVRDFSITYSGDRQASASNVGVPEIVVDTTDTGVTRLRVEDVAVDYSLFDAFAGNGPSLGYRLGLDRTIDPATQRALGSGLQISDNLRNSNQFEGRTTLSPSQALSINLNWDVQWSRETNISYNAREIVGQDPPEDARPTRFGEVSNDRLFYFRNSTEGGSNRVSVWAFGSYGSMFDQQLRTLRAAAGSGPDTLDAAAAPLSNASLSEDFRGSFLRGLGTLGSQGFLPFPMPNWSIRYSGLSDWPLLRAVTRSVSIEHSYSGTYESRFASVSATDAGQVTINQNAFLYRRPEFGVEGAQVSKTFQPFIGINVTWQGDLETSVNWNRSTRTFLRTASFAIEQEETSEVSARISYSKRGLDIPLLPIGKLNNEIRFSLALTRAINEDREYKIQSALQQAEQDDTYTTADALEEGNFSRTRRLTVTPKLTYRFSNRVSADFVVEYEKFDGEDTRQPSFTNVNGGFNVRVNISEN